MQISEYSQICRLMSDCEDRIENTEITKHRRISHKQTRALIKVIDRLMDYVDELTP